MKRDLPFSVEENTIEDRPRSMLASRALWLGGALSLAAWAVVVWAVRAG